MLTRQEILPAVAAVVFNRQGQVLLQRRKDVNRWGIISGHVEFGESVVEAMLREIREETNSDASITRFIGIYSSPQSQTYQYSGRTVQYVTSYFEATLHDEIVPGFANAETAELKYFPVDALPEDLAQVNPHWLRDALAPQYGPYMR